MYLKTCCAVENDRPRYATTQSSIQRFVKNVGTSMIFTRKIEFVNMCCLMPLSDMAGLNIL